MPGALNATAPAATTAARATVLRRKVVRMVVFLSLTTLRGKVALTGIASSGVAHRAADTKRREKT